MKHSLSYHITLFVLKLKGIKKDFSKDPIDVEKLRKEDVHHPKGRFFRQHPVRNFTIKSTVITEVKRSETSNNLLIFIHGGAFICGPAKHHWDTIQEIAKQSNHTVWMCDYPKAPEHKITAISENIDAIYHTALEKYPAKQIALIGDSVGGTLITALIQRLVKKNIEVPQKIILVSPVMDATMSNPEINKKDIIDPMLSKVGILSAKKMCAEHNDLSNPMMSPLNVSFDKFPTTILFLAENDIMYPDELLAVQKMKEAEVDVEVIKGDNMPHVWPFLPVMKEAKTALKEIIKRLNN